MPSTRTEALAERRTNLADWVTAILSIFWSVWWGFFFARILDSNDQSITIQMLFVQPSFYLELPKTVFVILNLIISAYFAYSYVHWLWNAQRTAYRSLLVKDLIRDSAHLTISIVLLLSNMIIMAWTGDVPEAMLYYGIVLTMIWPPVVLVTLWKA